METGFSVARNRRIKRRRVTADSWDSRMFWIYSRARFFLTFGRTDIPMFRLNRERAAIVLTEDPPDCYHVRKIPPNTADTNPRARLLIICMLPRKTPHEYVKRGSAATRSSQGTKSSCTRARNYPRFRGACVGRPSEILVCRFVLCPRRETASRASWADSIAG